MVGVLCLARDGQVSSDQKLPTVAAGQSLTVLLPWPEKPAANTQGKLWRPVESKLLQHLHIAVSWLI